MCSLFLRCFRGMTFLTILGLWVVLPNHVKAEEIQEEFIGSGLTAKTGGYRPLRAEMNLKADAVQVAPEGLGNPKYGKIAMDGNEWVFILDEPDEGEAKLFIDTNGDGDLTNDPEVTWMGVERGGLTVHSGAGKVELADGEVGSIGLYRFDPEDPRTAALKNSLMFYKDFGYQYAMNIDGKEFRTFLAGAPTENTRLPMDRNGDGQISRNFEVVSIGKPFNFTGTTYVISAEGAKLKIKKAAEDLPQLPLPPDLRVGKPALKFSATTMDGEKVDFPEDYAGKLVMLDMWATWCAPCIGEIPHMKAAYEGHHDDGFEILGVSFDSEGMEESVKEFLVEKELPWNQIYEGKGWNTTIGNQYDVNGIPFVLLVDGDSGEILATAQNLRGAGLSDFIGKELAKKKQ